MQPITTPQTPSIREKNWAILVNSIGTAGAGLVKALKKVTPLSENNIASLLYQAPSRLISDLPKDLADEMNQVLVSAGLDSQVIEKDAAITYGDTDHEVALVIRDVSRMNETAQLIIQLLGANIHEVRKILCTSPTVLLGKISKNTAEAIRARFQPLEVEVDISNPQKANFDVFLGECSKMDYSRIDRIFRDLDVPLLKSSDQLSTKTIIAAGLSRKLADQVWQKTSRTSLPLRIINRDFERFDLQLEALPNTPEAIQYLTASTGMPEKIAHKALQNLPIVLQQNIPFTELDQRLSQIKQLGGKATGHLLVFQTFSLEIKSVKDQGKTEEILQGLGGLSEANIKKALSENKIIEGPFTSLQARWLQHELKQIGTITQRKLR